VSSRTSGACGVCLQVGFGNIQKGFPGIKPFVGKDFAVLGQTQSHQAFAQAAHVGEWREREKEREERDGCRGLEGGPGCPMGMLVVVVVVVVVFVKSSRQYR
jgi:hypothetical protein